MVALAIGALSVGACSSDPASTASVADPAPPPSTTTSSSSAAPSTAISAAAPRGVTIVDFADPGSVAGWSNVDDTVMGGVSASSTSWENGALVFTGEVSLENNGGFTSVASPVTPQLGSSLLRPGGSPAGTIVLEGTGDGRTYVLQLRAGQGGRRFWTQSFTLPTSPGTVELPVAGFIATDFMLDPVAPAPVDAAAVDAVAIYLVDGRAGPFRLAITRMSAG